MSFYGRHYGVVTAQARSAGSSLPQIRSSVVQQISASLPASTPAPSVAVNAHTASLEQVAAAFEWYGLTVRPPGGFADGETLIALENHVSDLLGLRPTGAAIAAQQQAVMDAQRALQTEQQSLQAALDNGVPYTPPAGGTVADRQGQLNDAQSKANAYQAAQLGNQITVVNLALARSPRIAQALQASGDIPHAQALAPEATLPPTSSQQYGAAAGSGSFMDQYGTLVIAGGAAVAMLGLGYALLKKPKTRMAGYRRRRRS